MDAEDRFPHRVTEIEHCWIPLPDGTRLAARIWLPEGAENDPVPALLEYLPYHKRDFTAFRDRPIQAYMAGHGYVAVRVDIRGSGDSDGLLHDEYTETEQLDALDVIAWMRQQPWCNGQVGMWGISWGGFNALQVAARQPEGLNALIVLGFTDDRYANDVHYRGGLMLTDNHNWASAMLSIMSMPPDPQIVGESWREIWNKRLDELSPWIAPWMEHQRRDDYWQFGSICEDFSAIKCPVYAVNGWEDGYVEPVFRVMEGLNVPRKGLVGPWAHTFPQKGVPAPAIGFLQECVRWWDHWLKGRDTGIMDEAPLRVWLQDGLRPKRCYAERPGRWVAEDGWPGSSVMRPLHLTTDGLRDAPGEGGSASICSPLATGLDSGRNAGFGGGPDLPADQRGDDGRSLVYDSDVLTDRLELVGIPELEVTLSADKPQAIIAVRLGEVWPDGAVTCVSLGVLNLTHRNSHETPEPLVPGERYRVRVPLKVLGHAFQPGNRIRVSVSSSYWPLAFPSPERATLTLDLAKAKMLLPVRTPRPEDAKLPDFGPAEMARPEPQTVIGEARGERRLEIDEGSGHHKLTMFADDGVRRLESWDLTLGQCGAETAEFTGDDPLSVRVGADWDYSLTRGDWRVRTTARQSVSCDATHFHYEASVDAFEGETLFRRLTWQGSIPRDNM